MKLICLDLEGVLVPEIWIAFSEVSGISELRRTTRDEPDYDKLMAFRMELLRKHGFKLSDIQEVIKSIEPLPGAAEFTASVRKAAQLVILSDTFEQFAAPLMEKLSFPTLFCNSLETEADGMISAYKLRQKNGKFHAVKAFNSMGLQVFAAGDSFNDLAMIEEARASGGDGALFRPPENIRASNKHIQAVDSYNDLLNLIKGFLRT